MPNNNSFFQWIFCRHCKPAPPCCSSCPLCSWNNWIGPESLASRGMATDFLQNMSNHILVGLIIPNISENKTCSKPPTRCKTTDPNSALAIGTGGISWGMPLVLTHCVCRFGSRIHPQQCRCLPWVVGKRTNCGFTGPEVWRVLIQDDKKTILGSLCNSWHRLG